MGDWRRNSEAASNKEEENVGRAPQYPGKTGGRWVRTVARFYQKLGEMDLQIYQIQRVVRLRKFENIVFKKGDDGPNLASIFK